MFKFLFSSKGEIGRLDYFGGVCLSIVLFLFSFNIFDKYYFGNEWNFFINSLIFLFFIFNLTKKRLSEINYKKCYFLLYFNILISLGILTYLMLVLVRILNKVGPSLNIMTFFHFISTFILFIICLLINKEK